MTLPKTNVWPITFSLPLGLAVGGHTSWALRLTSQLLDAGRSVHWVVHECCAGFQELGLECLPRSPRFDCRFAPALQSPAHWPDQVRAYRDTLPAIVLPAIYAESYAVAAALSVAHADQLRVLAWNHSDNPYDYACLANYEPIIHRYVVNTKACRHALSRKLPARRGDIALIGHAIEAPPATPREDRHNRPIRIAYGGRIEQLVKRVFDLSRLARRLFERGVWSEMQIVGDGPQGDELSSQVESLARLFRTASVQAPGDGPAKQRFSTIELLDALPPDRMQQFWQWADVSILASSHEGLSVAMLEAMAAGCVPVVTAVDSGPPDVIRHGENGFVYPVGDVDTAAEIIAGLVDDPAATSRISEAARNTIQSSFSPAPNTTRFFELLDEAASAEPKWWPASHAITAVSDTGTGAGELTVPPGAKIRLARKLDELARDEAGPLVIYGAGRHTRALAQVWANSPVEIVGIIDDDPGSHDRMLWGWPIRPPEEAEQLGAAVILISSWLHEDAIWRRRHEFERRGLRVHRLYESSADHAKSAATVGARFDQAGSILPILKENERTHA
ncbi:MAG TPA: glycosyltransferase [Phycisphaerae bacterium]|nr:glycosyltransferase [Phycisphaerae bacterium]